MRWIVLLRGVNVGGHARLPMADLRQALAAAGARDVATYIQSGNIALDLDATSAGAVEAMVTGVVEAGFGHAPAALAYRPAAFAQLIAALPFDPATDPKLITCHLFHGDPPSGLADRLAPLACPGEIVVPAPHCLYHLHPGGIGRSKLAPAVPRALGRTTTARSLRSMRAIAGLAPPPD